MVGLTVELPDGYYNYIFKNSMDATIMITNLDGSVCRANPAACRILGWSEDEIIGLGRCGGADMKDPRPDFALAKWRRKAMPPPS
jgi:PAS domain-containing protein